jgi:hypothetical protein
VDLADLKTLGQVIVIFLAILESIFGLIGRAVDWLGERFWRRLRIVKQQPASSAAIWTLNPNVDGKPGMQIMAHLRVTNTGKVAIELAGARLTFPTRVDGLAQVEDPVTRHVSRRSTPIPPGQARNVQLIFFAVGQPFSKNEPFQAPVELLDTREGSHRSRPIVFVGW